MVGFQIAVAIIALTVGATAQAQSFQQLQNNPLGAIIGGIQQQAANAAGEKTFQSLLNDPIVDLGNKPVSCNYLAGAILPVGSLAQIFDGRPLAEYPGETIAAVNNATLLCSRKADTLPGVLQGKAPRQYIDLRRTMTRAREHVGSLNRAYQNAMASGARLVTAPANAPGATATAMRAPTDAAPAAPAAASAIHPDVIGVKAGQSTVAAARAAITGAGLQIRDTEERLYGQATAGRGIPQTVQVPNGTYISVVDGQSPQYPNASHCNVDLRGSDKPSCDSVDFLLSGPPNQGTVVSIRREMAFGRGPSYENLERSLIEKYGEPSNRTNYNGRGVEYTLAWGWSADGRQNRFADRDFCALQSSALLATDSRAKLEQTRTAIQSGCAAAVFARITVNNNVVVHMFLAATDNVAAYNNQVGLANFVNDYVTNFEQQERDKAAKVSAPKL